MVVTARSNVTNHNHFLLTLHIVKCQLEGANKKYEQRNMDNDDVVTVLFVLMITGFTLRRTAIKNNNEAYPNNWKFGDWKDEVKPQNPIIENVNKTEEVKEQIVASTYDEAENR